jgi:hypothetical protein
LVSKAAFRTRLASQPFNPRSIPGLALWLDAMQISGTELARDTFDRSRNLWGAFDPSSEGNSSSPAVNAGGTTTITRDNTQAHSGTWSWKVVTDGTLVGAGITGIGQAGNAGASINPGDVTTHSVWVKGNVGGEVVNVQTRYGLSNGVLVSSPQSANFTLTTGWQRLTFTSTAPPTAASVTGKVVNSNASVITYWVDDWQLERGTVATPFTWGDSTHLGSSDSGHAWTVSEGALGISSGAAVATVAARSVATVDVGTVDHEISGDLPGASYSGAPGLVAHYVDANNHLYLVAQSDFNTVLYSKVGGVATARAAFGIGSISTGQPASMKLSVQGSTVVATLNGATRTYTLTALELTAFGASTRVGVISNNTTAFIDNVSINVPAYSDGAALPVWPDLSGNYRHALQATAAKQPKFRTGSPNLLPYDVATADTPWTPGTGAPTTAVSSTAPVYGANSGLITSTANGIFQAVTPPAKRVACTPGDVFSAEVTARTSINPRNWRAQIQFYNGAGVWISDGNGAGVAGDSTYARGTVLNVVAPAGAATAGVAAFVTDASATTGESLRFDCAGLYSGSTVPAVWVAPVQLPTGKPCVQFDGFDDELGGAALGLTGDHTVLVVGRVETPGRPTEHLMFVERLDPVIRSQIYVGGSSTSTAFAVRDSANVLGVITQTGYTAPGAWAVVEGQRSGNTITAFRDGVAGTSSTPAFTGDFAAPIAFGVGGRNVGGLTLDGSVAAVVVFTRVLTTTERQQIEASQGKVRNAVVPRQRSKHDLRCFCRTEPLLAVYGIDEHGQLYVHVKIYKQSRVFGEVIVTGGVVRLRCRECLRWHKVRIIQPGSAVLEEDTRPGLLAVTP